MTQTLDFLPQKGSVLIISPVFHFERFLLYDPNGKKKQKLSHTDQDNYLNFKK